ncbi:hypothetical protein ACT7DJ_17590 [Bacillus cereus]
MIKLSFLGTGCTYKPNRCFYAPIKNRQKVKILFFPSVFTQAKIEGSLVWVDFLPPGTYDYSFSASTSALGDALNAGLLGYAFVITLIQL